MYHLYGSLQPISSPFRSRNDDPGLIEILAEKLHTADSANGALSLSSLSRLLLPTAAIRMNCDSSASERKSGRLSISVGEIQLLIVARFGLGDGPLETGLPFSG